MNCFMDCNSVNYSMVTVMVMYQYIRNHVMNKWGLTKFYTKKEAKYKTFIDVWIEVFSINEQPGRFFSISQQPGSAFYIFCCD
ncbi:hypothetical protein XELAEV_18023591mg [Xenopus laevis]|uniref:Uncharacterized protein n=1 Tax=Xenopus laevis TaxID=8355 RepID=A0A974D4P0_XENLA|nr:hypothetical protein XELAEV_18023591mg [Xenopus laevis]